jgi:hypothetical protein
MRQRVHSRVTRNRDAGEIITGTASGWSMGCGKKRFGRLEGWKASSVFMSTVRRGVSRLVRH